MIHEPPQPLDVARALRPHVEELRQLAALNPDDPFYAHATEQIAAIVTGLEGRATPSAGLLPDPANPGVQARAIPNQTEPSEPASATGGVDPVPPDPG